METFAIDSIDLGESDWQTLGYDLDGKLTTKDSTDVCGLESGAPLSNQIDGDEGIDDAFGSLVMPALEGSLADSTPSVALTSAIDAGRFTLQIQVRGLDDTPTQNCGGTAGQIFTSDAYPAGAPTFDSATDWPVMSESLNDPSTIASGSRASFDDVYVQSGTVVLGATGGVTVPLHLVLENGHAFDLLVHQALVTFDHVSAAEAANGVLAGVLDPKELTAAARKAFPSPTLCGDGWFPSRGWADIVSDRSNSRGVPCDAISFAIGFHARRVSNPTTVAAPLPVPPSPCP